MHGDSEKNASREELVRRLAADRPPGLVREFWSLLRHHRKWWLIPAIAVLLAAGLLLLLAGSGAAPFLYTLF